MHKRPAYLAWLYDLSFSFYSTVLIVTTHEDSGLRWSVKLQILYASHYHHGVRILTDEGYQLRIIAFLLIWTSVAVALLCVRSLTSLSAARVALNTLAGLIAVAGYPVASLYARNGRILFLEVELGIAILCMFLWAHGRWSVSGPLNIFLLILHFSLWAWFSRFPYECCLYLWPGWIWKWRSSTGETMRLVYPVLGFYCTLVWAAYLRQSEAIGQSHERVAAAR